MNYERAAASETDHSEHVTHKQNHSAFASVCYGLGLSLSTQHICFISNFIFMNY